LVAPYLACCILAVLAVNVVQSGFVFSPGALRLHGDRLNPIEGFKRIYSRRSLFEIVKNLAKVVVAGVIIWFFIRDEFLHSRAYMHGNPASSFGHFSGCIMSLLRRMTVAFCVLGVLDYLYQRHEYYRNMRMTRQEVKDEYKQLEGDPFLKQRQHVVRVKMLRTRMMENVKKARVVITNPTHLACALSYDQGMEAPRLVAKGKDLIAQSIVRVAREHDVPVVENREVARALYAGVEIEELVPPRLYAAVAEVILFVMQLESEEGKDV
jgi:flagellar biosynthetic protein FlhB